MLSIVDVYERGAVVYDVLYELLAERTPEQSISHKEMPTFEEHIEFVESRPYQAWYLVTDHQDGIVGACYLSKQQEIGIFILNRFRGKGYGKEAVLELMKSHNGPYYANINPKNEISHTLFENLGFTLWGQSNIEDTLRHE